MRTDTTSIAGNYLARAARLDAAFPLTGAQRRFLLARRLSEAAVADLVIMVVEFPAGVVQLDRLRAALAHVAAEHPVLTARPRYMAGVLVLDPQEEAPVVRRHDPRGTETGVETLHRLLAERPTDAPMLSVHLVPAVSPAGPVELIGIFIDHVCCDERGLSLLIAELARAYERRLGPADAVPGRQADVYRTAVLAQLEAEAAASTDEYLGYWLSRLEKSGARMPGLPPTNRSINAAFATAVIPGGTRRAAAPAALRAAALAAEVHVGSDTPALLAYPWGGGQRPDGIPGSFLNTVLFPVAAADRRELARVTELWWDDLDYAETPFDEVLRVTRRLGEGWTGQLDCLVSFEDVTRRAPLRLGGVEGIERHLERPVVLRAPFEVTVSFASQITIRMVWDPSLVADAAGAEMMRRFTTTMRLDLS
jgi:hypothetical protein